MDFNLSPSDIQAAKHSLRSGDDETLNRFLTRLVPFIERQARNFGPYYQDIAQDALIVIFKRLNSFEAGNFNGWVYGIVRNCARNCARTYGKKGPILCDPLEFTRDGGYLNQFDSQLPRDLLEGVTQEEAEKRVVALAAERPSIQYEAYRLTSIEGHSEIETAEIMGRSTASVKLLKHRFVVALREAAARDPDLNDIHIME